MILPRVSPDMLVFYLNMFFVFFFSVNTMIFGLTLHNSVFGKWKVPGFITACLSLGAIFVYCFAAIRLLGRSREIRELEVFTNHNGVMIPSTRDAWQNVVGLEVGRLPLFDSYIDLYVGAIGLAIGLIAFFATWYLLKNRVSLQ
jgi:hypothetical protein